MKFKSISSTRHVISGTLTVAMCATWGSASWAQREPKPQENRGFIIVAPDGATDDNSVMHSRRLTPADHKRIMQEMQQLQRMTPEERGQFFEKRRQQERESTLRQVLTQSDLTDSASQNVLLAFIREQEAARAPLRQQKSKLARALREDDQETDNLQALLTSWQQTNVQEKERYLKALQQLDQKIQFSTNPRLAALLTILGLLDDASVTATGPLAPGALSLLQPPSSIPSQEIAPFVR